MDLCYQLLKEKWRMKIVDKFEHKDKLEDERERERERPSHRLPLRTRVKFRKEYNVPLFY
jgi:hypothetical protein